jgi:ferredoxin-NADP reductase
MSYPFTLTLRSVAPVTHDTRHFVFDRPEGFEFDPGQATHLALDLEDWRDEDRPFTMVSDPDDRDRLEFVIKIYPDHDGMTKRLDTIEPGDRVFATEAEGAITDHGAGTFLAAGAGITPFIAILEARARDGRMGGDTLIFSNKAERDIILRDHWENMDGLNTHFVTDDSADDLPDAPIDAGYLDGRLPTDRPVYICGPGGFVDAMRDAAKTLGVPEDRIITEAGW